MTWKSWSRRVVAGRVARVCLRHQGLYITNLPYGASEDEIRAHFETLGEVETVVVCKEPRLAHHVTAAQDEDSLNSRGFGYVTYVPLAFTGCFWSSVCR